MLDLEDLYRGKGVQRGVTDLLDGRKLPIWFSAWNFYRKFFCASALKLLKSGNASCAGLVIEGSVMSVGIRD